MNAAVVDSFAKPPTYGTFADPTPAPGQLLVHVTAAGLHQLVRSIANGTHYSSNGQLPFVPGVDGAGRLGDGTRIYFARPTFPYGSFSELTTVEADRTIPLPDALDDATAAATANPAMSSWVALDRAGFTAGQNVLILGATGTSGRLAIQIAKRRGAARVVAAGRDPDSLAKLSSLGADAVLSLQQLPDALLAAYAQELTSHGCDVVLDYLWGGQAETLLTALTQPRAVRPSRPLRFVSIGSQAGASITLPSAALRSTNIHFLGSGFGSASLEQIRDAIAAFFATAAQHPFDFSLRTAPLADITTLWNEKEQSTRLVFLP